MGRLSYPVLRCSKINIAGLKLLDSIVARYHKFFSRNSPHLVRQNRVGNFKTRRNDEEAEREESGTQFKYSPCKLLFKIVSGFNIRRAGSDYYPRRVNGI